ncbi:hypothetical protein FNV43_RR15564 [Rhamnella rubrinervis]|uniref:Uncharacterized protein n=1 Tax=Rhamnella rubrinervis TaxID=2594499 RepID=A0A8K0E948_9ROSA|nr:hypothetical protein FNV43_RR15564 [Rhamnella rubrinervis]
MMPQVDLETLVSACAGGSLDRKIACETLANGEQPREEDSGQSELPPDFPPESFWLSKDAEYDWFDRNAFYERKESTKGSSNSTNLNPNVHPSSNSNSQRFSANLKSKAAIIGLPKTQKTTFVDAKNRKYCKAGIHLFPKRSGSVGKSDCPMVEPSSPKVSCMGRVRSKRDRKRRSRKNRPRLSEPPKDRPKPAERRKMGFLASFRAIFRSSNRKKRTHEIEEGQHTQLSESPPRGSVSRARAFTTVDTDDMPSSESLARRSVESEPPSLGGMTKFASGRRSESWEAGGGLI